MTESVIVTNRPPRMTTSSSVRVRIARPASAPPRASEPVSPMKILAGEAFHHRKPKHAPMPAGRDDREVVRVAHLVALGARVPLAVLVELPDADEHVGGEDHDRGAGGEAVEPVGEVHAVRGARHDDVGPDDEQDDAAQGPHERQVEGGVAHERHRGRGGGAERAVRELQREDREDHRDEGLPGELLTGAQPEAALLADLDEVVEEADQPQPGHEEEHEQAADRRRPGR